MKRRRPADAPLAATTLAELGVLHERWLAQRRRSSAHGRAERRQHLDRPSDAPQALAQPHAAPAPEAVSFRDAVGPVWPLKPTRRVLHRPEPPRAEARQRALDEQQALREAWSDEMDTDRLLETDEALSYRRPGIGPDVVRRLRRGTWSIQAACDLHGLRRDDAREALAGFLRECVRRGLRCVRVVHGKGNGSPGRTPVLRSRVRAWLVQKDEVIAFTQARAADGGTGALLVLLRPSRA